MGGGNVQPVAVWLAGQMSKGGGGGFVLDPVTTTQVGENILDGYSTFGVRLSIASGNDIHGNDLVDPKSGLRLDDSDAWPNAFYHNNVTALVHGVVSTFGPVEVSWSSMGSFWGHNCPGPLFAPGVDSNRADVVDSHAYGVRDAWSYDARPGCAPADADSDTVPDAADNCPLDVNPRQENVDGLAEGDACDVTAPAPPAIERPYENEVVAATSTIGGNAEPGSTIVVSDGGVVIGSTTTSFEGKFEFVPTSRLLPGDHVVRAHARITSQFRVASGTGHHGVVPHWEDVVSV